MSLILKNTDNLPPSSLHSFRRILKNVTESGELTEILIVDHSEGFSNLYYNSALDEYAKIGFAYHNISIGSDGTCMYSLFKKVSFNTKLESLCYLGFILLLNGEKHLFLMWIIIVSTSDLSGLNATILKKKIMILTA